jgi:hypothetical protein
MQIIAIISLLSYYVSALLAVALCVMLFRQSRQRGWLLVSVAFMQPFWVLLSRAIHGRQLFTYMTVGVAPDGSQRISYRVDFPVFYVVAIIGLYLLVRKTHHETVA